MKDRLLNILFWSVISAAFIGPGTVTTAAAAGAGFGYALIWALIFSTLTCYVLQEASARITAVSGINLGQAIRQEYSSSKFGVFIKWLALVAILSGCAAFETGNILGASAGISILSDQIPVQVTVLIIGLLSALILWKGTIKQIAAFLGFLVAVMGISFVITALSIPHNLNEIFGSGFIPSIPADSEILVLGLIGTTVVPYNIFLGSGLKHAQTAGEMKISLFIAIALGGLVSIAVLLTGTAIEGAFSFEALADTLYDHLGSLGPLLLALGLFGAGLSSTLTAALAASVTAKSILSRTETQLKWKTQGVYFRTVWICILLTGLLFGMLEIQPVPAIIFAQALNGAILPVIAVLLFLLMNNVNVLPKKYQNGVIYNLFTAIVVYVTLLLGLWNITRAISGVSGFTPIDQRTIVIITTLLFLILMIPLIKKIRN